MASTKSKHASHVSRGYECHVTVAKPTAKGGRVLLEHIAQRDGDGWKTSCIEGDPLLGPKTYFYFTCHDTDLTQIKKKMANLCERLKGRVLRAKIEEIMYDWRPAKTKTVDWTDLQAKDPIAHLRTAVTALSKRLAEVEDAVRKKADDIYRLD